jgi:hypothetical protein
MQKPMNAGSPARSLGREIDKAEERSRSVLYAGVAFAFVLCLSAIASWFTTASTVNVVVFGGAGVVCALLAIASAWSARWSAVALLLVIALWWLNWGLTLALGQFPGIPLIPGIATYFALAGTRAVFRYRRLLREDKKRGDVSAEFA